MAIGDKKPVVMQSDRATNGGVATLDASGNVPFAQLGNVVRLNLFDNAYLVNPVNQRGGEEYSNSSWDTMYAIDRWYLNLADWNVAQRKLTANGNYGRMIQRVEGRDLVGKTVTFSARVHSITGGKLMVFGGPGDYGQVTVPEGFDGVVSTTAVVPDPGESVLTFSIALDTAGASAVIEAVKLELGSTQTLAHQDTDGNWVLNEIPDYNEELLKCCMSTADPSDTYANNKRTPAAINAVNKAGDTMTGNLSIVNLSNGEVGCFLRAADGGRHSVTGGYNMLTLTSINTPNDYTNLRVLALANSNAKSSVADALVLRNTVGGTRTDYNILHTGNKPSGSYTGNGDATKREISTGGIGNVLIIYSVKGIAVVTATGAYRYSFTGGMLGAGATFQSGSVVTGLLTITSADECLNASGVTYNYQVP